MSVTPVLRPVRSQDREFLVELYISARGGGFTGPGWTEPEQVALLHAQYDLRCRHYAQVFPEAESSVVLVGEERVGRLEIHRGDDEVRIVDIAVLPEYRSRGVGTAVLRRVQAKAEAHGLPVRLHVDIANVAAQRLYRRLGFVLHVNTGADLHLEWGALREAQSGS